MPYHLATPQYTARAAQLCGGVYKLSMWERPLAAIPCRGWKPLPLRSLLLEENPVVDNQTNSGVVILCRESARHELTTADTVA